ncbi:MAG: hypothetical protein NC120_07170 [Ruminococcus sp.]|nr:hypothetical protein [Ruminococcus sp.]
MLTLYIPAAEFYDEEKEIFVNTEPKVLRLEHSLASISKWESKWHKPFLNGDLSYEETLDYIRCMSEEDVDTFSLTGLPAAAADKINEYINDPMTATTFRSGESGRAKREIITAEIVYYWMVSLNIPLECEHWHFNRLMTLIRVCSIKNAPPKKMSKSENMRRMKEMNAARRSRLNTRG